MKKGGRSAGTKLNGSLSTLPCQKDEINAIGPRRRRQYYKDDIDEQNKKS